MASDSNSASAGAKRKRRREADSSGLVNRSSKRITRARGKVMSDGQEKLLMNGATNPDCSLPSGTPSAMAEVQRPEPIGRIHDATQQNSCDFLRDANNIIIKDSSMIGVQVFTQDDDSHEGALQWLREHAMRGAQHDSSDRDPPPRCHPGTRTTIIQKVQVWLDNTKREKNLLWLRGAAGVGKSAIIQTLMESLSKTGRLGASLFFSKLNDRSDPRQVFPTLAYQFAVQNFSYRGYIARLKRADPEALDKAMEEQFRILIVEPFISKSIQGGLEAWVVALDGLDECSGDPEGRRHSNDAQREVVRLVSGFVKQHPSAALIWIIASRPETHLKAVFSEPDVVSTFWEEDVPVDSDEACKDVEKYLHKEFTEIGCKYPDHIRDSTHWPAHKDFLEIAHAARGLFIFVKVVIRFIGDPEVGNPIAQLECVLLAISKMQPNRNREHPLAHLDAIYIAILSKIPSDDLHITKRLLVFFIFLNTVNEKGINVSDCDFHLVCKILDIPRYIAVTALRHLHSVLCFPKVKDVGTTRPRFYHLSFQDFLEDKSRSHEYFIDTRVFTSDQFIKDIIRLAQAQFSSEREDEPDDCISIFVTRVLSGAFSPNGVRFLKHKTWITDSLSDTQLQPLLESLNIIKVVKYVSDTLYRFFWTPKEWNELELIRRGFLSTTTFGSLDIDWETVYISISRLGKHWHVQVDTDIQSEPSADDLEVAEFRQLCRTTAPDTKTRVWGHPKSKCRVVVVGSERRRYSVTGLPFLEIDDSDYN